MKDLPVPFADTPFDMPISAQIWDAKYRLKDPTVAGPDAARNRQVHDLTVQDTWMRIAKALAQPEQDRETWERRFYDALANFRFLPAGRITAGAGADRNVTLFNCFVMGTVPDSMEGIFDMLKEAALTMQQGGGIGYDFSTIRPRGAPVLGVGSDASGPLSFMDVWDAMCRTIMSAGSRRGAMMATMRCDHPDIEDFIAAKRDAARLRNFNVSVLVTDPFMDAVKRDATWDLVFKGKVWRTVNARDLWDKITRNTYDCAEPGVIFIDRINAANNLHYAETIAATNPCVTADTWVATGSGPRQVRDLIGVAFVALVDGKGWASGNEGFFRTGTKPVLKLTTTCGRSLKLTPDHLVRRATRMDPFRVEKDWIEAGKLTPGDRVVLHDQRGAAWPGDADRIDGYPLGLQIGADDIAVDLARQAADDVAPAADGTLPARMRGASPDLASLALSGRSDIASGVASEISLVGGAGPGNGIGPDLRVITPQIEQEGSRFQIGVLRGLFDAAAAVLVDPAAGLTVRLSHRDPGTLEAAQRMLSRLGIAARVMQDGSCGVSELRITGTNLVEFARRIGFQDMRKSVQLQDGLATAGKALTRERFVAEVAAIEPCGTEEVYDVRIPGINAFDANGIYVHNCGEQPLPPYGACLLGSINLARLVRNPFEVSAHIDEAELAELVGIAVRMMDNVVDASKFPLPQQAEEARLKRRIGLGVTGLADALMMVGLRYGDPGAVAMTDAWMRSVARAAYLASVDLAREKGPFPLFDAEKFLASGFMRAMDEDVREMVRQHGIRNALLTSIAPTGTISLYAGNVSSGIEPVFAHSYTRKVLQRDGTRQEEEVVDYAVKLWRDKFGGRPFPDHFVTTQTLAPIDHIRMQAAAQRWVDSSISKTVNCPEDISFEDFQDVYMQAWDLGCKGCTTYRPNAVTGSVLTVSPSEAPKVEAPKTEAPKAEVDDAGAARASAFTPGARDDEVLERGDVLTGATYRMRWPGDEASYYVTINDTVVNGRRVPFEIFVNTKNLESQAWISALTLMISAVMRRERNVAFIAEQLMAVVDARGGAFMPGQGYVNSRVAAIGRVIAGHFVSLGIDVPGYVTSRAARQESPGAAASEPEIQAVPVLARPRQREGCKDYGNCNLIMDSGCEKCLNCDWSRC